MISNLTTRHGRSDIAYQHDPTADLLTVHAPGIYGPDVAPPDAYVAVYAAWDDPPRVLICDGPVELGHILADEVDDDVWQGALEAGEDARRAQQPLCPRCGERFAAFHGQCDTCASS